jgi:hypothetical protein
MINNKVYLGDSVYADFDGYQIVLTTDNGGGPSNMIYIEPGVFYNLKKYAQKMWIKPEDTEQKRLEEIENENHN